MSTPEQRAQGNLICTPVSRTNIVVLMLVYKQICHVGGGCVKPQSILLLCFLK